MRESLGRREQAHADLGELSTSLGQQAFCAHYGLSASRNYRGVADENGIFERPQGHVKLSLEQKLILLGSCDYEEHAK